MTGDWQALAQAVKDRRAELRLPQDLVVRGGPGAMTARRVERAEVGVLRGHTKNQLECALDWPRGHVDVLLRGAGPTGPLDGLLGVAAAATLLAARIEAYVDSLDVESWAPLTDAERDLLRRTIGRGTNP